MTAQTPANRNEPPALRADPTALQAAYALRHAGLAPCDQIRLLTGAAFVRPARPSRAARPTREGSTTSPRAQPLHLRVARV